MSINWDDENNVRRLRAFWADGLTGSEIAEKMGTSKNSVLGKAHRLNLPARASPIKRDGARPPVKKIERLPGTMVERVRRPVPVEAVRAMPPVEVVASTMRPRPCCWPFGDPRKPEFRFCEAEGVPGKPYCRQHQELATVRSAA